MNRYTYEKRRKHLARMGRPLTVPITGFKRRARALMALGYTQKFIAEQLGIDRRNLASMLTRYTSVTRARHNAMVELYDRLSMTVPEQDVAARRVRLMAERRGWAPPLAWDDIDDPMHEPDLGDPKAIVVDEVKVERVLNGIREDCNRAEQLAVLEAWEGSTNELARITGWNIYRLMGYGRAA